MDPYDYSYRIIKTSWGIAIDIAAEIIPINDYRNWDELNQCNKIINGLWYSIKNNILSKEDEECLQKGLMMISKSIFQRFFSNNILIVFHKIEYNPCDYQKEGLVMATIQWAINALNLVPVNDISVSFNKEVNKYEFDFPKDIVCKNREN